MIATLTVQMLVPPVKIISVTDMQRFRDMFTDPAPAHPIPVDQDVFPPDILEILRRFIVENPVARREHRELSMLFELAFITRFPRGSEYAMVSTWDWFVRRPLEFLSGVCDCNLFCDRNVSDHTGIVTRGLRPDFLCHLRVGPMESSKDSLLMVGEEKDADLNASRDDLKSKIDISAMRKSGLLFIFAYAAGGQHIQYVRS